MVRGYEEWAASASSQKTNTSDFEYTNVLNMGRYTEGVALFSATASSGTSPTVTLKVQVKSDTTGVWHDHTTLVTDLDVSGANSTNVNKAYTFTNFGNKVRIGYKIGGTSTPTATFAVYVIGKD